MARNVFNSPRLEANRLEDMRSTDGHKLYVRMLSHHLDVDQLIEIFQQHGKVIDVYVSDKHWAFVTYEEKRDAQNALINISRSNLPLQVRFAHEGAKKNSRRSDTELLSCTNTRNVGRGHILNNPYFDGRHRPGMFEEAVFQDDLEETYFPNIQCTVDERGQRILKGFSDDASDRRSLGWSSYRNDLDAPTHHLSEDEVCKLCNRPAPKECSVCAMPYCSRRCQLQDYNDHRLHCTIPPLVDRKKVAHLEEILKEDNVMSKSQKGRNKDASNKPLEKDNKQNTDKSNENSTVLRNNKIRQDSYQNQKDGSKKNNFERQRYQNGNETLRNGKEKGLPSNSKHQDQELGNSMAATAQDSERTRESSGYHAKGNVKRKLPSNKFTQDIPSATDFKQKHQAVENSIAARGKVKDLETRGSTAGTVKTNEKRKLPSDKFTEVIVTVPEGPFTYWVQSTETVQMSIDVYGAVSTVGASAVESCEPKIGELYVAPFQGDWYRAKVISLQPEPKVLFVDYGNEEFCSPTDIKKLPESCKGIPHLAFRIKLVPGTSKKYQNLNADTQLRVKPVESVKEKDAIVVCVEDDEPQSESAVKYKYAMQKLKEGEHGIGKIIKAVSEEDTLVLMLTESTKEEYLEVKHLDELVSQLPVDDFKPKIGDLVAAEAEEKGLLDCQWGRAIILGVHHDKYLVHFVDHCLVLRTKNVRKLPKEIVDIPEFGSKLTILEYKKPVNGNWTQFFKTEGKFPFAVEEVNRNKNVTVAINKGEEKVCRAILSCWNPISDPNTVCLKNGTEVILVFFDLMFVYVRPVSISYMQMLDDLEEDLCKHCETASQLSSMPTLKSVMACKYGQNSTYYRAQVLNIFKDVIKVFFVDYGNEDTVKLESLKPLSQDLVLYPFMAERIPMKHITERDLTAEGTRLLLELSEEKRKLKVKLSNETPSGIELVMEDGITLNKKLNTFFAKKEKRELVHSPKKEKRELVHSPKKEKKELVHSPKKEIATTERKTESSPAVEPQSESSPAIESKSSSSSLTTHSVPSASTDKIYCMDEDLEYEGLPIGETVELLVLHKFNETDFTCCRRDSTALTYCIGTLQEEMTTYCNACEEQYRPREIGELCLAKFEDDGMWYRAVCIENTDNSAQTVKIVFVDFGNAADVAISHIRRMVAEYLKIPAVAHLCTIKGSEQMSEAKKEAIGSLIELSSTYPASIIEKKSSSYVIEMLHVTKALSSVN